MTNNPHSLVTDSQAQAINRKTKNQTTVKIQRRVRKWLKKITLENKIMGIAYATQWTKVYSRDSTVSHLHRSHCIDSICAARSAMIYHFLAIFRFEEADAVHWPAFELGWAAMRRKIVMTNKSRRIYQMLSRLFRCFRTPTARAVSWFLFDGRNLFLNPGIHSICSNQRAWDELVAAVYFPQSNCFYAHIKLINFVWFFLRNDGHSREIRFFTRFLKTEESWFQNSIASNAKLNMVHESWRWSGKVCFMIHRPSLQLLFLLN